VLLPALAGCATFRSYNSELTDTISKAASGNVEAAIKGMQKKAGKDPDLLYYLEMGELQRLDANFEQSQVNWMAADKVVQAWEDAATADPARVAGVAMSYILNDKSMPYEGHDYEKVMLTTRMAMNHLATGNWDVARVDIKRTHEREAVIARTHEQQVLKTEEEARKRGAKTSFKELNGYPVQTIDNAEVNALRNSYQSAVSHYLAGFIYEGDGEPSLAAAGYRQAIELQPNNPVLEEALAGLDQRSQARDDGHTDVLFIVETGLVPARESRQFSLPIPYSGRLMIIPVSFPIMRQADPGDMPSAIRMGGQSATPTVITNLDLMARRSLQEEMPGIILRGIIRSTAKAVMQYQANKMDDSGLAGLAVAIGSIVTESADEREWRTLPSQVAIARLRVPAGTSQIEVDAPTGTHQVSIPVNGRYAVVALRLLRGRLFTAPRQGPQGDPPQQHTSTPAPPGAFAAGPRRMMAATDHPQPRETRSAP
jgi:hypothetical protein